MGDMGNTKGVDGGEPAYLKPIEALEEKKGGPSGEDVSSLLHTKVRTLGELKKVMIEKLGEKDGEKLYNNFIKSFAMLMLTQVQKSAKDAQRAAKQMRTGHA